MDELPTSDEVKQFCSEIWENDKSNNESTEWIRKQEELLKERESQPWRAIYDRSPMPSKNPATGNHQEKRMSPTSGLNTL